MNVVPTYPPHPLMPNEFRLLVECCRHGFAAGQAADTIRSLAGGANWDQFVLLSIRHRVGGLAKAALDALDLKPTPNCAEMLADSARDIAEQNLRAAMHSTRLHEALANGKIECLFVKGLTLGKLAYGDPFVKMAWDVDLLVAPGAVAAAAGELRALGYTLVSPSRCPDDAGLIAWHRLQKESIWVHRGDGVHVELHSRLADNPRLIPGIGMLSPRQSVDVAPGVSLPTLATDELFAYLCVHGASSAWFRLKWISDLAGLLEGLAGEEIERLYRRSQQLGAGRASAQALLLADRLFGIVLPAALRTELLRSRANRWLEERAYGQLMASGEPTGRRFGTAVIHLAQLPLAPGPGFAMAELYRQLRVAAANR